MKLGIVLSFALLSAARGQVLMEGPPGGGPVVLLPSDAFALESPEPRMDLPCAVKPAPPELGFDFGYHSGYKVSLPLRELTGSGNMLTAIFRVTPEDQPDEPVYFIQKWKVPLINEDAGGHAELRGNFILGEGSYHVSWLLRDRAERRCSAQWNISAGRRGKDRQVQLRFPPGSAAPSNMDPFAAEDPVNRASADPLIVLVLLHLAPQHAGAATFHGDESVALLAMLRNVAREPRIRSCSIAAFNLDQNEILFRQRNSSQIDFPALGEAMGKLKLGTVDARKLIGKSTEADFLGRLLAEEMAAAPPDAVIFIGPKISVDSYTSSHSLKALGLLPCPAFYLNYSADPGANPWRDPIGAAVRFWRGSEYTITRPRDLAAAWMDVIARLSSPRPATGVADRSAPIRGLFPKKN